MNDPKRHHDNPSYYLERFQDENGKLWRLDKTTDQVVEGSAKTLGYKKYWNRLRNPPVGVDANFVEHRLAEVDDASAKVISQIIGRNPPDSIAPLAAAIAFMQNHQPRLKQSLKEDHADEVTNWNDDHFLLAGISSALKNWREYIQANFAVLTLPESDPAIRFLTSSNPPIAYENRPRIFLPISISHCLLLNGGDDLLWVGNGYMDLNDRNLAAGINQHTINNA